jgi:HSP20 family molecular chaperone IbpA
MAAQDWDLVIWRRANDLLQQAERIHRNFLRVATASQYQATHGRTPSWEPPLNVIETNESLWVVSALAGVSGERIEVRLDGSDLSAADLRETQGLVGAQLAATRGLTDSRLPAGLSAPE